MINRFKKQLNKIVSDVQKQLDKGENPLKDEVLNHFHKYGFSVEKDDELLEKAKALGLDEIKFRRYLQKQRAAYKVEKKGVIIKLLEQYSELTKISESDNEMIKTRALSYGFNENDYEEILLDYISSNKNLIEEDKLKKEVRIIVAKAEGINSQIEAERNHRKQLWERELKMLKEKTYEYAKDNIKEKDAKIWWSSVSKTNKKHISSQYGFSANLLKGYQDKDVKDMYYKEEIEGMYKEAKQNFEKTAKDKITEDTQLLAVEKQKLQDIKGELQLVPNNYQDEFGIANLISKIEVNASIDVNVRINFNIETNIKTNITTDIKIDNKLLKDGFRGGFKLLKELRK